VPSGADGVRVSDEDRERAAAEIREHYAAGRLNDDELSDRLNAIYSARTGTELAAVRTDLPVLPANERAELARRRSQLQRTLLQEAGGGVGAFLVCTVIWVAAGAVGTFWPIWVALIALIPLLRNGWRLYGPSPELDRVEAELARRQRQRSRQGSRPHHRRRHGGGRRL
jgi:hypothetical protein